MGSAIRSGVVARVVTLPLALLVLLAAGCSGSGSGSETGPEPAPPSSARTEAVSCGPLSAADFTGLVGRTPRLTTRGSVDSLRTSHRRLTCTGTGTTGVRATLRAAFHPAPFPLSRVACDQGWVYAGTVEANSPACQVARGRGGRTTLFHRVGEFLIRVEVTRPDRNWAGDPELAEELAAAVAAELE